MIIGLYVSCCDQFHILTYCISILAMLMIYVTCIFAYRRFFLGLRGHDTYDVPGLRFLSPMPFFNWLHDKITGRGDGFVGGPGLHSRNVFNGSANGSNGGGGRWGSSGTSSNGGGGSRWGWGKWGRQSRSNGYGRIPEEEQGILENDRDSFDGADEESTPRGANGVAAFDNAWAGARSGGVMDSDGVIRL